MTRKNSIKEKGPIAWMVKNHVTANLLMIVLLVGGFFTTSSIKMEVFPEFALDVISISVSYPGASPEEIEKSILLAIEKEISGQEGIKEITSVALEGSGRVTLELMKDADDQHVLQEIEQKIARISSFPKDAEDPDISLESRKRQVIRLNLYGDVSERELHDVTEQVKDQLLLSPGITQVYIDGKRDREIIVEIPADKLRIYQVSLADISRAISNSSVEIPGGKIKTTGGEILLRITNRSEWGEEFEQIPVISRADGTIVHLGDIAEIRDGFEETDEIATYDRMRSMQIQIYRVGDQTPIGVSEAAYKAMEKIESTLPPAISWKFTSDSSIIYQQRLELLLKNALIGIILVLILLGLFLEVRLAFWVTMGIPISFLGALLFLPGLGVSINMISMFAFIVTLGIVVDDAIIAGENIYEFRQRGYSFMESAIKGGKDIAIPIAFSILTNIAAFLPLYFVPGMMGRAMKVIPLVTITVFLISWLEAVFILPAHLAYSSKETQNPFFLFADKIQQKVAGSLHRFISKIYVPILTKLLHLKLITISVFFAVLVITGSYVFSGRIGLILMPRVESDRTVVTATLPYGSPLSEVEKVRDQLITSLEKVVEENGGKELCEGIYARISENVVLVEGYLKPADIRPLTTRETTRKWREQTGQLIGLESIRFESDRGGPGSGAGLSVEISHKDIDVLELASASLTEKLEEFDEVKDVDSGIAFGKVQYDFTVSERGLGIGLTPAEVARQVRNSFQGSIALRQMRGSNEVTVRVQLPEKQRSSEHDIESLLLKTPASTFVPLQEIATVTKKRAFTHINRRDGRRTLRIKADVEPIGKTSIIMASLKQDILPELGRQYPGLSASFQGRQASRKESMTGLKDNFIFALFGIYFLLAIPFRSYLQPLTVMLAIPFGMVGAVIGHLIMGYSISLMSVMGIVALSGIVVNDALVLIDYANKQQQKGKKPFDAIREAGERRFRPVVLTTLTTFGGLTPMIFETSMQARFMIPMAVSLGFGIIFATVITLILVPCFYLFIEETKLMFNRQRVSLE